MARAGPSQLFEQAVGAHRQGRLAEAEGLYRQVLDASPEHAEAHNNRGIVLEDLGRIEEALASYERAAAIRANYAEAHNNRGNALASLGRLVEALASYEQVLKLAPSDMEALSNRGNILAALGRHDDALASYARALAIMPDHAGALYNRGNVLAALQRYEEALSSYDRALASRPDFVQAHDNRGNVLLKLRRYEEALESYDRLLAAHPAYAEALNNRGTALEELRRYGDAIASYDRALAVRPGYAEALSNRGNALSKLKYYDAALASYDRVLAIKPRDADVLFSRGNVLAALRRPAEALASYEQALAIDPDHSDAFGGLAGAALAVCDWARSEKIAAELPAHIAGGKSTLGPFALLGYSDDPALLLQCARTFVAREVAVPPAPLSTSAPVRREKIRIAYASADFRDHVIAYQIAELIERHDRARFEVVAVSLAPDDNSAIRARLNKAFDRVLDVSMTSDAEAAKLLHELEPDIAVDLMGHTRDARMRIFAHRPAPIQATYFGYAGTTGAGFFDYIVGDPVVLPFEHQPFYTEKIVQLPDSFFVSDSNRAISARTPSRRDAGLPEQGFVFCCFNNNAKIRPAVFEVWMRLLKAVPGGVLWLSSRNPAMKDNLAREAAARGVAPDRLVFAERVPKMEDHLARHRLADLFLDTLPYNAHATAADALWAALPVVTCCGHAFGARVGASLLDAVGLPDLVTHNLADYEALALRLARDPPGLTALRRRLEQNRTAAPLFDTDRLRLHLESAYTTMCDIRRCGEHPKSFRVPAR